MPSWLIILLVTSVVGAMFSFWGWLAVKVIDQGRKLVELEGRMSSQETNCHERLEWLRGIDEKTDTMGKQIAKICGALGVE